MPTLSLFALVLTLTAPIPKDEPLNSAVVSPRQAILLRDSRVQRELGLTADKRIALLDFFEAWDEEATSFLGSLYPPSGPPQTKEQADAKKKEHDEFIGKQKEKMRTAVAAHLTAAQHARLKELERRFLSLFAFQLPDVAAELKLSAEQLKAIRTVVVEYRVKYEEEYNSRRKPSGLSPFDLAKPYLKTIDESLTAAQRTRMTELLGAEPKQATTGTAKARETIDHAVLRSPEFFPR